MTPEQEDQVRRALGGLDGGLDGGPEDPPIPADVAARLDTVLADLVEPRRLAAERTSRVEDSAVGLAARRAADRRRRRRGALLVAAAVVVVVAGGGLAVVRGLGSSADSSSTSDSARSAGSASSAGSAGTGRSPTGGRAVLPEDDVHAPRLRSATFGADVRRLLVSPAKGTLDGRPGSTGPAAGGAAVSRTRLGCLRPPLARGDRLLAVRLDGRRATLVLGTPTQESDGPVVEARAYSCATTGRTVATATVPVG